jgi:hypothetical protein
MKAVSEIFTSETPVSFPDAAKAFADACGTDFHSWWQNAPQGDWLIWSAGQFGVDLRLLVLAAAACTRTSLYLLPESEMRPSYAIDLAERWTRGEATEEECANAADKLYNECKPVEAFGDSMKAAAAMTAVGAAEAVVSAAGRSHDRDLCVRLATISVNRTAIAARHAGGLEAMRAANRNCAQIVRQAIPISVFGTSS